MSKTDRARSRAHTYAVALADPRYPGTARGMIGVDAPTRTDAWTMAADYCAEVWQDGRVVPRSIGIAPMTRGEYERLRSMLGGSAQQVKHAATGVEVRDPRAHGVHGIYAYPVHEPRDMCEIDPDVMARAGAVMDRENAHGRTPSPVTGRTYVTDADRIAAANRVGASKVPEAFRPTGEWCAWIGPEGTAPRFASREEAERCMRIYGHSVSALYVDGELCATFHSGAGYWDGPGADTYHGGPLLRVLGEQVDTMAERQAWVIARAEAVDAGDRARVAELGGYANMPPAERDYVRAAERPRYARLRAALLDMAAMLYGSGVDIEHVAPDDLAMVEQDPRADALAQHAEVTA